MSAAAIADIPAASAVVDSDNESVAAAMPFDDLVAQLKLLSQADLFKLQKQLTLQLEKATKAALTAAAKPVKAKGAKRNSSYKQLEKPRAWIDHVLEYSLQNGWEAFSITQMKKDKKAGVTTQEITDMPESECVDGVYYYKGTVDPTTGKGKTMITKHAMTLSKIYWSNSEKKGTRPELYEAFSQQYDAKLAADAASAPASDAESEQEAPEPKVLVVRKTASQKSREAEEKKAAKEAEKAAKVAAKEAEKAAKAAAKEAEKASVKTAPKSKAAPKVAPAPAPKEESKPPVAEKKKPVPKKAAPKKAVDDWVAPDEEGFHDWTWEGKLYFRNAQDHVFSQTADAQCGDWMGQWIRDELRFDMIETPAEYLDN